MTKNGTTQERPVTAQRKQELLDGINAYVDANLHRRITLSQLSEHFGVSVSTVTQLFQRKAGTTFHQFLTQRRMAAAEEMIRNGMALEEVGKKLGYSDHSSFYRCFRQTYGVSPREFRQGKTE